MHENDLFWSGSLDVIHQAVPVAVRAESKGFDSATEGLGMDVGCNLERISLFGGSQPSGGRVGVGVSDKEDAVGRVWQEMGGDDVGEGVFCHHAARQGVDAAGTDGLLVDLSATDGKGGDRFQKVQTLVLAV